MRKIFCVVIFWILVLCGCSTGVEKGNIPFSPEEIQGKEYEHIVEAFEKEGFTNIKTAALLNLETETEETLENKIDAITIDGESTFKKDKKIVKVFLFEYFKKNYGIYSKFLVRGTSEPDYQIVRTFNKFRKVRLWIH